MPSLLTTVMYPATASLLRRLTHVRSFHSPFVVLNAHNTHTSPTPPFAPTYEKQHDSSPEPHLSSSGTRTYVVSEPDPSNTPYQVPTGAYPTSAPYHTPVTEGLNASTSSPLLHPYSAHTALHGEAGVGRSAAVRNTAASAGTGHNGTAR